MLLVYWDCSVVPDVMCHNNDNRSYCLLILDSNHSPILDLYVSSLNGPNSMDVAKGTLNKLSGFWTVQTSEICRLTCTRFSTAVGNMISINKTNRLPPIHGELLQIIHNPDIQIFTSS